MASDLTAIAILGPLLEFTLALSAGVLLVLAARRSVRRVSGAATAYTIWLIPLAAGLATLLPARTMTVPIPRINASSTAPALNPGFDWTALALPVLIIWSIGAALSLAVICLRQQRAVAAFGVLKTHGDILRAERAGPGPAVIGVLRPRLVLPSDFETRFTPGERALILAHEHAHIAGGHTRANALVAVVTAINWFNPLIHLAARVFRADQELACDAAVAERNPGERRTYGEALLKTQLSPSPMPLGCYWPARSTSLLKERLVMLAMHSPGRIRRLAGASLIAAAISASGLAAWALQPEQAPPEGDRIVIPLNSPEDMEWAKAELAARGATFTPVGGGVYFIETPVARDEQAMVQDSDARAKAVQQAEAQKAREPARNQAALADAQRVRTEAESRIREIRVARLDQARARDDAAERTARELHARNADIAARKTALEIARSSALRSLDAESVSDPSTEQKQKLEELVRRNIAGSTN